MGNTLQASTAKYMIVANFEVEGVVEKPDVIGAIFGQTEGLFGPELDLRELQKNGRIGRIEIQLESKQDITSGTIMMPSNMDRASTALIAAALESIDKIGPCDAKIILDRIEDLREAKRKAILEKAKEILKKWVVETAPTADEVIRQVSEAIKMPGLIEVGPERLPAGPKALESESIIIVEGRADVINLLKAGIQNAIAVEGVKIPKTIIELSKGKETIAFLDGDRTGDLILKELMQVAKVDYVARAPPGYEVEDLTPKEIMKALMEKVLMREMKARPAIPEALVQKVAELQGTLEAILLDDEQREMLRIPVSELAARLQEARNVHTVIFDGVVTQRLVDIAVEKNIRTIIGDRIAEQVKRPREIGIMTIKEVLGEKTA